MSAAKPDPAPPVSDSPAAVNCIDYIGSVLPHELVLAILELVADRHRSPAAYLATLATARLVNSAWRWHASDPLLYRLPITYAVPFAEVGLRRRCDLVSKRLERCWGRPWPID